MSRPLIMLATLGLVIQVAHAETPAEEAYRLRMEGRVDQAKTLLTDTLQKTPADARAHYELARTHYHMSLGEPQERERHLEAAAKSIAQAIKLDDQQVMYHTFAGHIAYIQTYISLKYDRPTQKARFAKVCNAFEAALQLKPDYPEVLLYLVELHTVFPKQAGAERAKAKQYAERLNGLGTVWASKARSILAPKSTDVQAWKAVLEQSQQARPAVLEELGKRYLRDNQVDAARKCFAEAVEHDAAKSYLFLDLSIYHTWQAIKAGPDIEQRRSNARSGLAAISEYLASKPIRPMQAYALGVQSKYKAGLGEREASQTLLGEARTMDPYFSRATGAPHPDLFIPPTEISSNHRYLMRPF